ncbi:hypothetical protein ZYGR_0AD01730 [Zygosaccharomyces rouxii]|uniref:Golgi to ER traffic protein 1 n=2 Tax=Zygosaccharomyces rouxii TaxID=4956 RepID=GET1_ZYGRC|nr:uncharacterized protein ZYRO0G09944g [Zygosaccharomyces rouxii]C5E057.1 RecName: Full=Golgi to ER traffic protein 1; AltName: Full=Guided entry of tail-anchored proteins 1 [Zygosaccharomyces rouxii CBS 732]KAH9202486.1 Golgi to ER traffic protein 1 [Zygosaccharomyces rouxii]GAV50990.1 hypothetical protein ZYGR_0AD01730 [Zygosaccharomyces rouxii]CAR29491.1 ZYRO0G09944p [Zygosaccharomyces rouxii]
MDSGGWIVYCCIFFILLGKVLEYTSSYQDKWFTKLTLTPEARKLNSQYHELLSERLRLQEENHSISAQDNYARWTKNNRKLGELDKKLGTIRDKLQETNTSSKKVFGRVKLIGLTIPFWILKIWQRSHVVYHFPKQDLFPKLVTGVWARGWLYLALGPLQYLRNGSLNIQDYAPHGVSLGIWIWALQATINTLEFLVKQVILEKPVSPPPQKSKSATKAETKRPEKLEITDDKVELD